MKNKNKMICNIKIREHMKTSPRNKDMIKDINNNM